MHGIFFLFFLFFCLFETKRKNLLFILNFLNCLGLFQCLNLFLCLKMRHRSLKLIGFSKWGIINRSAQYTHNFREVRSSEDNLNGQKVLSGLGSMETANSLCAQALGSTTLLQSHLAGAFKTNLCL